MKAQVVDFGLYVAIVLVAIFAAGFLLIRACLTKAQRNALDQTYGW